MDESQKGIRSRVPMFWLTVLVVVVRAFMQPELEGRGRPAVVLWSSRSLRDSLAGLCERAHVAFGNTSQRTSFILPDCSGAFHIADSMALLSLDHPALLPTLRPPPLLCVFTQPLSPTHLPTFLLPFVGLFPFSSSSPQFHITQNMCATWQRFSE